ncbi:dTDP-4-dehydrorhamnose 3,5-epimerase [Bacteroidota bacterium]
MEVFVTKIPDLLIIQPKVFKDSRGYFFESYNKKLFEKHNINVDFIQDNESKSTFGVIRGLHYQLEPHAQAKLVRVLEGKVLDIAVDIRRGSPTFKRWHSIELSAENKKQFLIPKGFAHGFVVLSETATFSYKCDEYYYPDSERGIIYNDPALKINWGIDLNKTIVSEKDKNLPLFTQADYNFTY